MRNGIGFVGSTMLLGVLVVTPARAQTLSQTITAVIPENSTAEQFAAGIEDGWSGPLLCSVIRKVIGIWCDATDPLCDVRSCSSAVFAVLGDGLSNEEYDIELKVTFNGGTQLFTLEFGLEPADGMAGVPDRDLVDITDTTRTFDDVEVTGTGTTTPTKTGGFAQTLEAQDTDTLGWRFAADVRFVQGDLDSVASYGISDSGVLLEATSLDISSDSPAPGDGFYYLVRPEACGSWQSTAGAEPARDAALP